MNKLILPVESIQEREIDLLILEELAVNHLFGEWFVEKLGLPKVQERIGAWRSIVDFGLGETDILFSYSSKFGKIFLLIENKLDASFQEKQFERYEKRAEKYVERGECKFAYSVLIAPKLYCENQNDFESYLTYEAIGLRFTSLGTERDLFKSELLKIASEKLRRGYKPVNSEVVQRFWNSYYDYRGKRHSKLDMRKPGIVPHNSDWPMLFDKRIKGVTFYHKLAQGNVDATFVGFPPNFEEKLEDSLLPEFIIKKHRRSFSVRIFSGKIDRTKDFHSQVDLIEKGLANIERLREWILNNERIIINSNS